MIIQSRRNFITGLTSLLAAPAIVRVQNIMPVKVFDYELMPIPPYGKVMYYQNTLFYITADTKKWIWNGERWSIVEHYNFSKLLDADRFD